MKQSVSTAWLQLTKKNQSSFVHIELDIEPDCLGLNSCFVFFCSWNGFSMNVVLCVFSLVCFEFGCRWLQVQSSAWKNSSLKWPVMCSLGHNYLLTHSICSMLKTKHTSPILQCLLIFCIPGMHACFPIISICAVILGKITLTYYLSPSECCSFVCFCQWDGPTSTRELRFCWAVKLRCYLR